MSELVWFLLGIYVTGAVYVAMLALDAIEITKRRLGAPSSYVIASAVCVFFVLLWPIVLLEFLARESGGGES